MANNISVSVTADTSDLTAKMAVAKAAAQDFGKEMRSTAKEIAGQGGWSGASAELKQSLIQQSEGFNRATNEAAIYARQMRGTGTAVNDNARQMNAGMQNLGFQLQDVAVQFASGQRAGTIFAQQLPQISGALTQIAQAGGNASGLLGRFAAFMSGPWGVAVGVGTAVLAPFIGKLFETGNAAQHAAEKVYGLREAIAQLRSAPMQALGLLQSNVFNAQGRLRAAEAVPIQTGSSEAGRASAEVANANRERAIAAARIEYQEALSDLEVAKATAKTNESLFTIQASAGRLKAFKIKDDDGDASAKSGNGRKGRASSGSDSEAEAAARAEIAAQQAANQQIEALAEDRYQTEAELSKIALRSKIDDIEAEQRAGNISGAQAISGKAAIDAQIEGLDQQLQAKIFNAKLTQLEADRRNYKAGSAEYERYTRQIELLQQQHLNRQVLNDARTTERERAARRQAQAAELADTQRAETQKRAIMERSFQPFAATIARMVTLQRGFLGTMSDLWGSLVGIVDQAVTRMITMWLVGLAAQDAASERQHAKQVIRDAKQAASGAYKAVVGIPVVGPILAPIAAAAAFAGVVAFSAEDGWDVPGGGGAGIDGRGGRPAIIHPHEMVLPAQIADSVRALPGGLAAAASVTASLQGASASVADINTGALSSPRIGGGSGQPGSRRQRGGGGGGTTNVTIRAMDARSFERFAKNNPAAFGTAVKHYVRNGGRA